MLSIIFLQYIGSSTGLIAKAELHALQLKDRGHIPVGLLPLAINVKHSSSIVLSPPVHSAGGCGVCASDHRGNPGIYLP